MALLEVRNLSLRFGGIKALSGVNLTLRKGMTTGLIGPNGAGKTTLFNILTGVYAPSAGTVALEGKSLVGLKPHRITKAGIARTFQNIRLFGNLTVLENVLMGRHIHFRAGLAASFLAAASLEEGERRERERALEILRLFGLADKAHEQASCLPYGDQRRLEMARALATEPRLLCLDEPAAGMNPKETAELTELIRWIGKSFALTILLIEHDMNCIMSACEHIFVLDHGVLIAEGSPQEIRAHPKVVAAYLGEEEEHDA